MILTLSNLFYKIIIYPIWKNKSLLFIKNIFVNIINLKEFILKGINYNLFSKLSICYWIYLLKKLVSFSFRLIVYIIWNKSKIISDWYIIIIYISWIYYTMYWFFIVIDFLSLLYIPYILNGFDLTR